MTENIDQPDPPQTYTDVNPFDLPDPDKPSYFHTNRCSVTQLEFLLKLGRDYLIEMVKQIQTQTQVYPLSIDYLTPVQADTLKENARKAWVALAPSLKAEWISTPPVLTLAEAHTRIDNLKVNIKAMRTRTRGMIRTQTQAPPSKLDSLSDLVTSADLHIDRPITPAFPIEEQQQQQTLPEPTIGQLPARTRPELLVPGIYIPDMKNELIRLAGVGALNLEQMNKLHIFRVYKAQNHDGLLAKQGTFEEVENKKTGKLERKIAWYYIGRASRFVNSDWLVTLDQAKQFGGLTAICCICGAQLTAKLSVELGIGPVCGERIHEMHKARLGLENAAKMMN